MTPATSDTEPRPRGRHRRRWLAIGILLLGLVLLLRSEFRLVIAVGESMRPTLESGDLLVVHQGAYRRSNPRRGDIVVVRHFGEWIVKRIVGLPGETLEVNRGTLLVNRQPLPENHRVMAGSLTIEPGRLREGRYALLGDNRDYAVSESIHAVVSLDQVLGKVVSSTRWLPSSRKPDME